MAADKSPWIADVAEADFEREVIERSREQPVVIDFWAPWCAPCRLLGPVLEKLVAERDGAVRLAKINVDEAQNLAVEFAIEGIPAVKAMRDGKVILEFVGVLPEGQLRQFLDRLVPSEADKQAKQAAELEATNPAEAEKLYRQALEKEPSQPAALLGLARALLARGQEAEAETLLERVTSREDHAEVERLRAILALKEAAREFGDEAALRQRLQKEPSNAQVQYELGCVVAAAGRYKEALDQLLTAGQNDKKLAGTKVKEAMVRVFHVIGVRSDLADEYRDKLTRILY
ncbi:MAG: tetratricopeptide repeat protein [Gemmataceae bacterium]|nr:tetratricopeptide repeat protein [Gemmataceae bacterium]